MHDRISTLWNTIAVCMCHEDGQDLVEYGLVIALIAFGCLAALQALGQDLSVIYSAISSTVTSSVGG